MPEPARLYFLRHGQTTWNADGNRYAGASDVPLTELGVQQARSGGDLIRDIEFDAVFCSGLRRALDTARLALDGRDIPIVQDPRLNEMNYGDWEGKTHAEILAEPGNRWLDWAADPDATRPGNTGELASELVARVTAFLYDVMQPGRTVLAVAHHTTGRLLIAHSLEMPLANYRRLQLDNASLSLLERSDRGDSWQFINRT
ncbi:MAG: histidine phosphatase family protein [Thermomicrobiales bacterium]